ncbi:MAG: Wzz/FepE/Etk N-terminal domain-containing protein, partial [Fibrobacterota bacterium]
MNNASDIDTASFAQKSSAPPPASIQPAHDPDEINLLEYFYVLVKNKWVLLAVMFVGLFGGYVAALIKGPSFVAEALIAPRESESQGSPNLSELGMFGGMVASQLNLGGNASLENVDLVLDSRKFNAEMIEKNELLPLIYAEFWD